MGMLMADEMTKNKIEISLETIWMIGARQWTSYCRTPVGLIKTIETEQNE